MVLSGFEIGTDAKLVAYPDRYMDGRGQVMWDRVCGLVAEEQKKRKMALCA
jgi:DNA polymerase I